jgi:hypothetical protein
MAPQNLDVFAVADGYRYNIVARWGDSLVTGTPDFDTRRLADTSWLDTGAVATQERQFGTNADAVQYFPEVAGRAARGLVCVNHEYFSGELVFTGHRGTSMKPETSKAWLDKHPDAIAFMQAAHGVTVMQIHRDAHGWTRDLGARENRRITARTPMDIHGPARGHALMRTNADPTGTRVLGTFANCSAGKTPWGTYLTSEEKRRRLFRGRRDGTQVQQGRCHAERESAVFRCANTGSTAGTTRIRASTRAPNPTSRSALAGWWRSTRTIPRPSRASAPRSAGSSTKAPTPSSRRAAMSSPTWATTRNSNTSTNSFRATASIRRTLPPIATCSTTARCTARVTMPMAKANGCHWCTTRTAR